MPALLAQIQQQTKQTYQTLVETAKVKKQQDAMQVLRQEQIQIGKEATKIGRISEEAVQEIAQKQAKNSFKIALLGLEKYKNATLEELEELANNIEPAEAPMQTDEAQT